VRVDGKQQGGGSRLGAHCGEVWGENFLLNSVNSTVKNAEFYAFLLRKTILVARN